MKRYNCFKTSLGILIGSITIAFVIISIGTATAESETDIVYPIAELGSCANKEECMAYCEKSENIDACLNFAEKYDLLSENEIEKGRKFAKVKIGPGGCTSHTSCEAYCSDVSHIEECVAFAEQNGLMEQEELEEAKKIKNALQKGAKMPGGCKNKETCEAYCESGEHVEECIAFAEAAGFMDPKEAEMVRKTGGKGPGGCKGKNECEAFCEKEENFESCLNFAAEHNLIPADQLEMARKTGGKGPGGCRGRACENYCNDSAHGEECFRFAKENGFLKEEDIRRMDEGKSKIKEALTQAPPEVATCLKSVVGEDILTKLDSGEFFGGPEIGEKMRSCFEQFMKPPEGQEGMPPFGGEFQGPGGCKGEAECKEYCASNPEECKAFAPSQTPFGEEGIQGRMQYQNPQMPMREFVGPGECRTPEECQKYCSEKPEACQGSKPAEEQMMQRNIMPYEGNVQPYPTQNLPCNSEEECLKYRQEMEMQYREQMQNKMPTQPQQGTMTPEQYKMMYPDGNYPKPPEGEQYQNYQYPNEPYSSASPDGNYPTQPSPPSEPVQESVPPPPPESLLFPLYPTAFILQVFFGLLGL